MGMTLEQKIKTLIELYHYIKGDTHFCGYIEENATNALETAIDVMKKYQKMEKIILDSCHDMELWVDACEELKDILNDSN